MTEGHNIVKVSELGDLFIIGGWRSSSITKAAAAVAVAAAATTTAAAAVAAAAAAAAAVATAAAGEVSSRISCEAASFNLIMAVFLE